MGKFYSPPVDNFLFHKPFFNPEGKKLEKSPFSCVFSVEKSVETVERPVEPLSGLKVSFMWFSGGFLSDFPGGGGEGPERGIGFPPGRCGKSFCRFAIKMLQTGHF